ncbi:hypothetical protein AB0D83_00160 [Streptomyces decoyicus]|uniref:hypothetical protein n=1 Tax=Streptomyces decoyicus TaxID=249567 RepID=UPI0033C69B8A
MPSTTWAEASTRKPDACQTGRGEPPPGFHASTAPYMELMRHRVAQGHGDESLAGTVGLLRSE